jgi:dipeptidyl aminopeptidase/acylaminoacyl peptidase
MRSLHFAALAIAAVAAPAPAAAAQRTLQIGDMARIVDVEEPAISPDGKRVAVLLVTADAKETGDVVTLETIDAGSGRVQILSRGRDAAVPRWSPDGSELAYLASPVPGAPHQLFVRDEKGRTLMLTHVPGDVIDAVWRPDGHELAFVAADPASNGAFFYAGNNDYTATSLTPPDHLWLVSSETGKSRRLTHGSWTIAPTDPGGIFSSQITWTHDGKAIAFTRVESTFSGEDEYSTIWQIDVASGATHKLTNHPDVELTPDYSPNGSRLAYWYPVDGDFTAENTVRLISGNSERPLASAFDRNVAGAQWFPDGKHLLICAADGTQNRLWTSDLSGAMQPLDLGALHAVCDPYSSSTFDAGIAGSIASDGTIAVVATSASSARELYLLAPGSTTPRQLTHVNDFLHGIGLGAMDELTWDGPDGFHEDGVVTYPPASRAAQKHPVVLLIHGGPGLSNTRDFVWERWPLAQMIASHGYVVLQPNYRGSDNLGNAYMTAIVHDTVAGPSADILAGLAAVGRLDGVDASRVAVSGWSYGGELTSWLIGHDHRWRAAVSGAAVNSEFDEYNLSESNVQDRYPLGATPYTDDGERIYRQNSPITYYAQITTPTLIWGTTLDPVVPITQSYALYHALVENHVPVRFAVFPASTHGPADARQTAELTRLWLGWLDSHLR